MKFRLNWKKYIGMSELVKFIDKSDQQVMCVSTEDLEKYYARKYKCKLHSKKVSK